MESKKVSRLNKLVGISLDDTEKYLLTKFPYFHKRYILKQTKYGKISEDIISIFVEGKRASSKGKDFPEYEHKLFTVKNLKTKTTSGDIGISNILTDLRGDKGFQPFLKSNFYNKVKQILFTVVNEDKVIIDFLYFDIMEDVNIRKIIETDYNNIMTDLLNHHRQGHDYNNIKNFHGEYVVAKYGKKTVWHQFLLKSYKKGLLFNSPRSLITGELYPLNEYFKGVRLKYDNVSKILDGMMLRLPEKKKKKVRLMERCIKRLLKTMDIESIREEFNECILAIESTGRRQTGE